MLSFKGRHFEREFILMSIRRYVAYPLSYRGIEELMLERGVDVDHSTINRWVIKYTPKLEAAFTKRYKRPSGCSWRMDETYIKIKGRWCYLYRGVDKQGQTIDFFVSKNCDKKAAKCFFNKAIGYAGKPEKVTIDKSRSNLSALNAINRGLPKKQKIEIRQVKYLNNIVEQDHRFIKRIVKPMLGFKSIYSARATLSGIELHHMLRKGQRKNGHRIPVFRQFYNLAA